jgi:shikimate dehydrogenase
MHNAAFRECGVDLVYVALPVHPGDLEVALAGLATVGTVGANVTVPHKQAVLGLCDRVTEEASLVGAVNTLTWTADGLVGDNTDARGLALALEDVGAASDAPTIVFGTGGAARAAVAAAARRGSVVTVVGRRMEAAEALVALARDAGASDSRSLHRDDPGLADAISEASLIINATPLGMRGERLPEPFHALQAGQIAYDLVYGPDETPFVVDARAAGVDAHGGITMLVAQAQLSFIAWTGLTPPAGLMSARAVAALALHRPPAPGGTASGGASPPN